MASWIARHASMSFDFNSRVWMSILDQFECNAEFECSLNAIAEFGCPCSISLSLKLRVRPALAKGQAHKSNACLGILKLRQFGFYAFVCTKFIKCQAAETCFV